MNTLQDHFEVLYNDSPNPCTLTDIETNDVVFANYAMKKMLKDSCILANESESNKCYHKMHNLPEKCEHCIAEELVVDDFLESHVYNKKVKKHFRIKNTLIDFRGKRYNFCKYFVTSSYTDQLITFEEALTKSVEIFSHKGETDQMTTAFLELLATFYDCEKSYIFSIDQKNKTAVCTHSFTQNASEQITKDITNHIKIEQIIKVLDSKNEQGILEIKKGNEKFNIENFTSCVIEDDNNEIIGMVGIGNKKEKVFDYRLLKTISKFIREGFSKNGMEQEIKKISEIDFLTGFYSRAKYAKDLQEYKLKPPENIGVIFININGLRKTNEYMGFLKGDEQIINASKILKEFFEEKFYRISGDEFICFCDDECEKTFLSKINRLQNEFKKRNDYPFAIGHAFKKDDIEIEKLISQADTIMYINKQAYYHLTQKNSNFDNESMLNDLLMHIANDEFIVHLQPQVNLKTGGIIGAEALVRRFDKENNIIVPPNQFIPVYEKKSIIRHVDIFVLDKVCQNISKWEKKIPISVNLSRVTLMEFDIVNTIIKICDKHNVPHDLVIMEITERVGLIENEVATTLIDEFKENGFKVSLDDFGCAYSNIVTLANISVDEVKIDKSLVDNLVENEKNQIIVDSVVSMCKRFKDTHTLAEGIETKEQAKILKELGCEYGQGYLYSKPIECEEFYKKYIK